LAPSLAALLGTGYQPGPVFHTLRNHCLNIVKNSLGPAPEKPPTSQGPEKVPCSCRNCSSINKFLKNPGKTQLLFKMSKSAGEHVQQKLASIHSNARFVDEGTHWACYKPHQEAMNKYEKDKADWESTKAVLDSLECPEKHRPAKKSKID